LFVEENRSPRPLIDSKVTNVLRGWEDLNLLSCGDITIKPFFVTVKAWFSALLISKNE
jgi:hypothetical protein